MAVRREPDAPVEPQPTDWRFPRVTENAPTEIIGVGADLRPATVLAAYRNGVFPMPFETDDSPEQLGWWSPNPRGILPSDGLRVSRSLRRSLRRYRVTINQDFGGVIDGCRLTPRGGGWITQQVRDAYVELFRLGWAHSVETWDDRGRLVGGLYGVGTHGLFAGESMFSLATDASKVALVRLVDIVGSVDNALLDVQWRTEHLASLGVIEVSRQTYSNRLSVALREPSSAMFKQFQGAT